MTALYGKSTAMLSAAAMLLLIGTGCATKKHVRQTVGPVEARVSQTEKRNAEQQAALGELENSVSRADERAMDAERKASAAGQAAQDARGRADQAQGRADSAHTLASSASSLAESTRARLASMSENIDNYKLVTSENILFGLNKATLTKDAQAQLDQAVGQLQNAKNFVLEIQGFTDATGSVSTNLDLSRRRADAVVRYLTVKHNVPLRKINVLGVGEDDPTADNKTREGRKQARRVELRVFSLDLGTATNASNTPGASTNPGPATSQNQ